MYFKLYCDFLAYSGLLSHFPLRPEAVPLASLPVMHMAGGMDPLAVLMARSYTSASLEDLRRKAKEHSEAIFNLSQTKPPTSSTATEDSSTEPTTSKASLTEVEPPETSKV